MSSLIEHTESEMTLTVLGCGTMGIGILSGILSSLNIPQTPNPIPLTTSGTSTPAYPNEAPTFPPFKVIACDRRPEFTKKSTTSIVLPSPHNQHRHPPKRECPRRAARRYHPPSLKTLYNKRDPIRARHGTSFSR
ncbi:uncharacterized protein EAF01_007615 [Botrytis porri]|uniref:uncharacterized protein n=1 Tax=Botrytis porri TaxID=87229 RepID=UPI00190121A8|nr:uncharacterized protein EAF01_007615 [Botrytis porri]KAF7900313.1 hypothetical protein EAF01_007615 [Botrytis porri]